MKITPLPTPERLCKDGAQDALEQALRHVNENGAKALAIVIIQPDGNVWSGYTVSDCHFAMLGALTELQHDMMSDQ